MDFAEMILVFVDFCQFFAEKTELDRGIKPDLVFFLDLIQYTTNLLPT